ncbi:MAG: phosphoglycerate dehydrogenase [Propionicimonas sp.]|uniref:phosphoglycerate dehydrogenase n=1 Tax=Propionicimonas sp. TaxID=1955623 RepID=UPI002B204A4B|nr:phosphoglycerate dehydrogenase [Propionicimonas sp.]MEA4944395.1 phosphoglycerate dehydrogenase [Propionicimonas sp.]
MDTNVGAGKKVMIGAVRWDALCANGRQLLLDNGFSLGENMSGQPYDADDMYREVADADAAVCGVEVWDASVFERAPRVRVIARLGVGLDNIDLAEARRRGVDVVNVPGGNACSVGELALALILSVLRKLPTMNNEVRAGAWDRYVGEELSGKRVGLVGFGATGRALAKLLSGFGCPVRAYDPYADEETASSLGVELVSLSAVLQSEVVSLHVPHLPSTHHIINAETIALMPAGSVLVNVGRGPLVDEAALVEALSSGHVAGAGLDVFEVEPVSPDNPLFSFPSVVATTHAGADTVQAYDRIGLSTAQAIVDVFSGKRPVHLAN